MEILQEVMEVQKFILTHFVGLKGKIKSNLGFSKRKKGENNSNLLRQKIVKKIIGENELLMYNFNI